MIWLRVAQGVLCAVEICGLYYLLQVFFDKRSNKAWSNILWFLSGVFLCFLTIYQRETVAMYSRYYMVFCVALTAAFAGIYFKGQIVKIIIISFLYYESICFFDIFLGYIGQAIYNKDFLDNIQFVLVIDRVIVMTISRIVMCILLVLIFHYKKLFEKIFTRYKFILAGFAVLEYIGIFFCDQIFIPSFRLQDRAYIYLALFPMLIIFTLVVFVAYLIYKEKENEIKLINIQNEMMAKNYHEMTLLYQKRERIFHDMKNHLAVLSSLISEKDFIRAEEYINNINNPILILEHKKFTGNRIVDIILNDKIEKAESCGINVTIQVSELKENIIQDVDWCAILANVLDNAIEACCELTNRKRIIDLFIMQNDRTTVIEVSNTYNGKIVTKNNRLISKKENSKIHGMGMENISNAVDKYNGVLEYNYSQDIFKINISLFN